MTPMAGTSSLALPPTSGKSPCPFSLLTSSLLHDSVGHDGTIVVANAAQQLFQWNGNGWTQLPGGANCVAVNTYKDIWATNAGQQIWHCT